jgi:hypothetical protein
LSTFSTAPQNRTIKRMAERAREAAVAGDWEGAVEINQEILKHVPQDASASNRLGKALDQLGRIDEAIEAYQASMEIDASNVIAQRNIQRLEQLRDREPPPAAEGKSGPAIRASVFIEETGKTYVTELVRSRNNDALTRLSPASEIELRPEGDLVAAFDQFGNKLGYLEPRISRRVRELIEAGNQYQGFVIALSGRTVRIIVREVYRHPDVPLHMALPPQAKMPAPRPYIRDTAATRDLDPDLYLDDEDETDEDVEDDDLDGAGDDQEEDDTDDDLDAEEVVGAETGDEEDDTPIVR